MSGARASTRGASLVEVMTAATVFALLLALLLEFIGSATRAWDRERSRAETLRLARNAMALIATDLASVCRSPCATNLVIGCGGARGDSPWLAALVTRPGNGCDVCAVGYRARSDAGGGEARLVRSFLPAGATLGMLRSGEDPLGSGAPAIDESIAPRVRDLCFAAVPKLSAPPPSSLAFTTNLPDAIEISFSMAGTGGADLVPFRCRLPLR